MKYREVKHFVDNNIRYKDWEFHVKKKVTDGVEQDAFYLQIQFMAPDNFTGKPERQFCRKWLLSEFMTATEIVRTAFLAVGQAERHEMEENFKYKGRDIYNSHIDVGVLVAACEANAYEHRSDPKETVKESTVEGTLAALKVLLENAPEPFPLPSAEEMNAELEKRLGRKPIVNFVDNSAREIVAKQLD